MFPEAGAALREIMRGVRRKIAEQRVGFALEANVWKICWGKRAAWLENEFENANNRIFAEFWGDLSLFYQPVIRNKWLSVGKSPLHELRPLERHEITDLSVLLAERSQSGYPLMPWRQAFRPEPLQRFLGALSAEYKEVFENRLEALQLPITSCHGDLTPVNTFKSTGGKLAILDWEYSNPEGCVVPELVKLNIFAQIQSHRAYRPDMFTNTKWLSALQSWTGVSREQLILLGFLSICTLDRSWNPPERRARLIDLSAWV